MFDDSRAGTGTGELFDPKSHQGHLLIVRVFDEVSPVVTKHCPTGYVERNGKRWPNNAVRCAIADLDETGEDGQPGKIYPEVIIFTGLLVKDLKKDVGRTILVVWRQKDPSDKSSPYTITEMKSNEQAYKLGMDFGDRHPEFMQIPAPPEWKVQEPQQQGWGPQDQRQGQQPYPQAQQQQGYSGWGADARPGGGPRDHGQHSNWGQPQQRDPYAEDPWARAPQGNGSFLDQTQGQNHWGQRQSQEAPF